MMDPNRIHNSSYKEIEEGQQPNQSFEAKGKKHVNIQEPAKEDKTPSHPPLHDNNDGDDYDENEEAPLEHEHQKNFQGHSMAHSTLVDTQLETSRNNRTDIVRRDEYGQVLVDEDDDAVSENDSPVGSPSMNNNNHNDHNQHNRSRSGLGSLYGLFTGTFRSEAQNGNSSFARTKSIGMMIVKNVVDAATLDDARIQSPFQSWNRQQLVDILIAHNIELRGETAIRTSSLRELAEEYFKGRPIPAKPKPLSRVEFIQLEHYVLIIQNLWVEKLERRRNRLIELQDFQYQREEEEEDDFDYAAEIEAPRGEDTIEIPLDMIEEDFHDDADQESHTIDEKVDDTSPYQSVPDIEQGILSPSNVPVSTRRSPVAGIASNNSSIAPSRRSFFGEITKSLSALSPKNIDALDSKGKKREKKTLTYTKSIHVPKKAVAFLDLDWKPPALEKALKYIDFFHPRKGGKGGYIYNYFETTTGRHCCLGGLGEQCDITEEGQMSEFAVYGPGVTNYFKFIKWCFWVFFILTCLTLPLLALNYYGPFQYNGGLSELSITTVGNLASSVSGNYTERIVIPVCRQYGGYNLDCSMNRYYLGQVYSWTDVGAVSLLLLAFIWLRYFEAEEGKHLDKNTLFASQYTIMVTNLPPTITEDEIKSHFQEIVKNYPIAQLSVAYDNEQEIELCRERGKLIRSKKRAIHGHRYFTTITRKKHHEEKNDVAGENLIQVERLKFFRNIRDIDNKIKRINKHLSAFSNKEQVPLAAFITFNDEIAANVIMDDFTNVSYLRFWCGFHKFRIHTKKNRKYFTLKVTKAPEPSTILWENLKYGSVERFIRRSLSTTLAFLMVFLSIAVTLGAKYFSIRYYNTTGTATQTCPQGFTSLSTGQQKSLVEENPDLYTHCFCARLSDITQAREPLCREYLKTRLSAQFFTFFSSAIVLFMNSAIEAMIHITAKFEKHHTEDSRAESVFIRLFLLKYINTGAIFLIDNNYSILKTFFGVTEENSSEFSSTWYQTVGVSILLVQLGNIFTAHADKILSFLLYKRRVRLALKDPKYALTQDDLNKAYLGPLFRISFSYAQIISTIFVCLTFSTGMPLLYPIAAANFFIFYALEKYLFVRCYRSPPRWSSKLSKQASALIPIACILHLCMSIWVVTDPGLFASRVSSQVQERVKPAIMKIFGNSSNVSARIVDDQSFRLFVFAVVIGAMIILRQIIYTFEGCTNGCAKVLCCCFSCKFSKISEYAVNQGELTLITYSRAIQRNLIKGLATYNILQNPQYKEDFGITWKFAVDHDHIRSIRFDQGGAVDEEDDVAKAERLNRERNNAIGLSISPHLRSRFFNRGSAVTPRPAVVTRERQSSNSSNGASGRPPSYKTNRRRVGNNAIVAPESKISNANASFIARQNILLEAGESNEAIL